MKEVFPKVRRLLESGWTSEGPARAQNGRRVEAGSPSATKWSLFGALAIFLEPMSPPWEDAVIDLMKAAKQPSALALFDWSESSRRTKEEVLEIFSRLEGAETSG